MKVFEKEGDMCVPIMCWADEIEDGALEQAKNLSTLPFVKGRVVLMPDVHQGYGMPIGGVIACEDVIIPNAVGVDIGCGMVTVPTNMSIHDIPKNELKPTLRKAMEKIKKAVPVGFNVHNEAQECKLFEGGQYKAGWTTEKNWDRATKSLGTLGGGNHFIEIQMEEHQDAKIWIMIHSGSRNLGKVIADYYHRKALEECHRWNLKIPTEDLAFLHTSSPFADLYLQDMSFALQFAVENRNSMLSTVKKVLTEMFEGIKFGNEINIHHNYANLEKHMGKDLWVHRKGATSAKKDQFGIIPGSMGTPSYIVLGKGNLLSFNSCSHGAGRSIGRMAASRKFTTDECDKIMGDVVFDRWNKIKRGKMKGKYDLGEAPLAYKDIDKVINNQLDLVSIYTKLLPLAVVKG